MLIYRFLPMLGLWPVLHCLYYNTCCHEIQCYVQACFRSPLFRISPTARENLNFWINKYFGSGLENTEVFIRMLFLERAHVSVKLSYHNSWGKKQRNVTSSLGFEGQRGQGEMGEEGKRSRDIQWLQRNIKSFVVTVSRTTTVSNACV